MPSPAAEAHQKEMNNKFAPAKEAMLKNATPSVLYTHHVMGVYEQYDLLGRVNAVSNNHHNARPILERLVDHALFAMKACVEAEAEEARRTGKAAPEIADHHGIALVLDRVSEAVADGDYVRASENLERFLGVAIATTLKVGKQLSHATHTAVAGDIISLADRLQDHYLYPEKYVNGYQSVRGWFPITSFPEGTDQPVDLWVELEGGGGERVADCTFVNGKWLDREEIDVTEGPISATVTHFRYTPLKPRFTGTNGRAAMLEAAKASVKEAEQLVVESGGKEGTLKLNQALTNVFEMLHESALEADRDLHRKGDAK